MALRGHFKKIKADAYKRGFKNGVWVDQEAKVAYIVADFQQLAAKVFCNSVYGWMSMQALQSPFPLPVLLQPHGPVIISSGVPSPTATRWCPQNDDDYEFLKRCYDDIARNVDKLPYNAKDFAKRLLSKPFPASRLAGDQSVTRLDWEITAPKSEADLDRTLKTMSSDWGMHVAYGDTDNIMVALWMVLALCTKCRWSMVYGPNDDRPCHGNQQVHVGVYMWTIRAFVSQGTQINVGKDILSVWWFDKQKAYFGLHWIDPTVKSDGTRPSNQWTNVICQSFYWQC